jgi:hypothetical protein
VCLLVLWGSPCPTAATMTTATFQARSGPPDEPLGALVVTIEPTCPGAVRVRAGRSGSCGRCQLGEVVCGWDDRQVDLGGGGLG